MKKKILILDFDGTLGDTNKIITTTMQATCRELNLKVPGTDECSRTIGLPLKGCFQALMPMDEEMAERCADVYSRIFAEKNKPGSVPVFPNVIETLKELHEREVIMSLASSRSSKSLRGFVDEMQLNEYITFVLGAEDVTNAKPNPEPVLKTLEHYGVGACDAMVVGDMSYDILMGKGAGCLTCGVTYGNGTKEELVESGADYVIDDFSKVLDYIE